MFMTILGGCVMTPPVDDTMFGPEAGSYYVDQADGKLQYFQLAQTRGEPGEWIRLHTDGEWYAGAGFYVIDERGVWSQDENAIGVTLDEVIQLHDPAPAAPAAE